MSGSAPLPIAMLFENADIVVKDVLLLLLGGSVWSWAVIIDEIIRLRVARRSEHVCSERCQEVDRQSPRRSTFCTARFAATGSMRWTPHCPGGEGSSGGSGRW